MWRRRLSWLLALAILGCSSARPPEQKTAAGQASDQASPAAGILAPGEPRTPVPVEADDARLGSPTAQVTVIAFLDYSCRETFSHLLALREKYEAATLRIVFKHLPLTAHPMALPAAIAGQAVSDEAGADAFFAFSQRLFEHQEEISYVTLADWAEEVGVPRSVYNEAVSSELTLQRVSGDAHLGIERGAEGTPFVLVNGRLVGSPTVLTELVRVIDAERPYLDVPAKDWPTRYAARVQDNAGEALTAALLADDPLDYRVPVGTSAKLGSAEAPVTLVVFTDYQCPYCKRADGTLRELLRRHPGELRLVHKHLPLPFHHAARPAARLAEAIRMSAGDEAFFAVSAELFERSPKLGREVLVELGRRHGLAEGAVDQAISGQNPDVEKQIALDLELADDVLAEGTPHSFINGKRISGARPLEHFEALFVHEKRRAEARVAEGVGRGAVYADLQSDAVQPGAPAPIAAAPAIEPRSPTRGPTAAPVTIHVFSDFECPYCRNAEATLLELERLYPGQLLVVWHDRPLEFHPQARPAARAGREAMRQGGATAFWKLQALLFGLDQEKAAVSRADLIAHAKTLGLDSVAMEKAIDSSSGDVSIDRDIDLATSLGFQGTPAFLIGRYPLTGARDLRHFERLVGLALAEHFAEQRGGGAPAR
jgi:protein-disulfide isomerase